MSLPSSGITVIRIKSEDRFFEIAKSMPKPCSYYEHRVPTIPEFQATAYNDIGIYVYVYMHSGLVGLDKFLAKMESLQETNNIPYSLSKPRYVIEKEKEQEDVSITKQ